jgi:hypothetical protein
MRLEKNASKGKWQRYFQLRKMKHCRVLGLAHSGLPIKDQASQTGGKSETDNRLGNNRSESN